MKADQILDQAIAFAAERWRRALGDGTIPPNLNLRDQALLFGSPLRKALVTSFPALRVVDDQVLLLVMAEGIAQSGSVPRDRIERDLGIILPPMR